uniref:Truncated myostatin isoform 2 n=1 Tax=Gecarcinus lateralis TaxID=6769 RepID=B4YSF3_GECLA|nr:truncated myostatin precursor isoform 2 [Gecarcinus lateralis]
MPWKRLALVLLLMLLQAAATEARARRNNSHSRTRGNRRTQQQQHERLRTAESEFSELLLPLAGDTAHTANTAVDGQPPPPPPPAPPQHSRRPQHHASTATHRTQHHNRRRHHQGEGRHHRPHQHHHHQPQQQQQQAAEQECPSCYQLEMRKNLRLAQIKDRVLTATGLINPPNMTGVVISSNPDVQGIIEDMQSAVPMPSNEPIYNQDEPDVKTEMLFFPVEPGNRYKPHPAPPSLRIPEGTDVLYFKLNHTVLGNRARRAILHVWLKPINSRTPEMERQVPASLLKASVSVFKVARPKHPGGGQG